MKVFGTGLQRTGTTSLGKALGMLGIATRDHPHELWDDLDHAVSRRFDAFTDNPIPLLYRQLDVHFPGAKFVHTMRDETRWLASVKWLFTVGAVKFRWDQHASFHVFHRRVYGTTEFDEAVFLAAFRRHNRAVQDYFAGRPRDLLVLDITAGDGFETLCPFLGVAVPAQPFPHWNRTESLWKVRLRRLWGRLR